MENKSYALLIDADNVSSDHISLILNEISKYGTVNIKRIYGDWTDTKLNHWKEILLEYSITPIQQYGYTTGKNSTDSSLIIDAMDILFSRNVSGFGIVSSDSDFARLASRLRESGKEVIGLGISSTTAKATVRAYDKFIYLDILSAPEENGDTLEAINLLSQTELENTIVEIINESGEDGSILLSVIGDQLNKRHPDFDVRSYHYTNLSKFIASFGDILTITREGTVYTITLPQSDNIQQVILDIITKSKGKKINMGQLNKKLLEKVPGFSLPATGTTRFKTFLQNISELEIDGYNVSIKK